MVGKLLNDDTIKKQPQPEREHLHRLGRVFNNYRPPVFFVTLCSFKRRKILTSPVIANEIISIFGKCEELYGWEIGRYVIMPDHVHFFCRPTNDNKTLSDMIRDVRKWVTRKAWSQGIDGSLWQREFFDHLLRSGESFAEKWEYVRNNPVRAGLCDQAADWPWQGECANIMVGRYLPM